MSEEVYLALSGTKKKKKNHHNMPFLKKNHFCHFPSYILAMQTNFS